MKNLFDFSISLKSRAKKIYQKHEFVKEWQTFILISIFLKLGTILFSVFAGFFYFDSLFVSMLNNPFWAKVFSIFALLIIEVLTAIALSKFFKFALRLDFKSSIPILFLSVFFFFISFVSSTNGLALRQSQKVDNTEILTAKMNDKILNINLLYDSQISEVKEHINTIKSNPQGWNHGTRTILLEPQLNQIDKYYESLQSIEASRKADLNEAKTSYTNDKILNDSQASNESEKFYKITAFIMILVFCINGLLMFFYSRVFSENEKEIQTIEVIQDFSDDIQCKAVNMIESQIQNTFALYFSAIQGNFEQLNKPLLNQPKSIGFQNINKEKPTPNVNTQNVITTNNINRICIHCGKEFIYKTWNQKFCADDCRVQHWEGLHNRKIVKGRKSI